MPIFNSSLLALSLNITHNSSSDMQKVLQNFTCRLLMAPNTEQLNTVTHSRINEAGASNAGQPCKTTKLIEMPFGMWTLVGPRKHYIRWGAHWRHLANMSESSVYSDDADFFQITLTTLVLNSSFPYILSVLAWCVTLERLPVSCNT